MMGNQETQHQNTKTHQPKLELSRTHKPRPKLHEILKKKKEKEKNH